MTEIEWVTKKAPGGIEINITVEEGVAKLEVTATSDDGQILHMSASPSAAQLRTLSQMAREAAKRCRE